MQRPVEPFRTQRLLLRLFTPRDLDALHSIFSRPDVTTYLDHGPLSLEATRDLLDRIVGYTGIDEAHGELRLAVVLPDSGELIGDVSLWRTSAEHAQGEIGFVVHPDHQGRGYAFEGMSELLRIGFEEAAFHRIVGRCEALNNASAGLMERLGMRREGHFRENAWIKEAWSSELVYAMLASEWAAR
jgi:RimJ/RimL family protein N-acetyltransferase